MLDALDSLAIWVPPGEGRPFVLANRSGTYLYGSTGASWDSGWMGLWVNRKRVLDRLIVRDANGEPLAFSEAWCRVTPADVLWQWPGETAPQLRLFFTSRQDTLYYYSTDGIRLEGAPWIQPNLNSGTPELRRELLFELYTNQFSCADTVFSKAVNWANLQLLFLLAEDDSLLYAGIPWFNEGWGRDTFISLPGLLVTGHAEIARKLLLRFATWLDTDPASPSFGRVPNRVRPGEEIAYNTADGTPWWILGLYYYGLYNRDYPLWEQVVSAPDSADPIRGCVEIALAGALGRTDSLGFLKHGDADTWMDAVGPNGPVTPRGNRAVEIAALHHASLDAATRMTSAARDISQSTVSEWRKARRNLENSFVAEFGSSAHDYLYDRLLPSGQPDSAMRPNQIFALTVPLSPLLPPQLQTGILKSVTRNLVHEYGVLSLSPKDSLFHPFHMDDHYPKDDAYHNGIVWTWLSGPVKSTLTRAGRGDLAHKMANYETKLLAQRGCVGSLPEVTDAMPRSGQRDVALSGTISQAWSLAEFLRTTYQDFLGIRPIQITNKMEPFWLIDPRIPQSWGLVKVRVILERTPFIVMMQNFGDSLVIGLQAEAEPSHPIGIKVFDEKQGITGFINATEPVHLVYRVDNET
ncbi:MAG: amylo-alpha-1,6-glucosidase, partial [Calditrichota bacterium]